MIYFVCYYQNYFNVIRYFLFPGILLEPVKLFLENNLPKSKKKHPVVLGVVEIKLATVISEVLGIDCSLSKELLDELVRGKISVVFFPYDSEIIPIIIKKNY